jgi:hypothetical protein
VIWIELAVLSLILCFLFPFVAILVIDWRTRYDDHKSKMQFIDELKKRRKDRP